ncbi:hypothetical protein G6011_02961 [Alternaria panax]|uniref:Uncharacterized protein n=1 Tax=Alternaria panax TaxID=48097 RepID=A0AAD4I2B8_9PLEO|nr:hypothetical protein G6011_02961 [Alternaria panax]
MSDWDPYSFYASRSKAYKVLLTVAATLTIIRKKLPAESKLIYDGYYDDIIRSNGRAKDSAIAMATFVERFPVILRFHNRLAVLQNPEIEEQKPGEGRVKFPVVGDGTAARDDDEDVIKATLVQEKNRNKAKWQAEKAKRGNMVVAPENILTTAPEPQSEMREDSPTLVYSPTIANTEMNQPTATQSTSTRPVSPTTNNSEDFEMNDEESEMSVDLPDAPEPVVRQSSAILSASPTISDTEHTEEDDENNGMSLEPLDEIWDDLIWPHGAWIDGLEAIDNLPWARPRST